MLKSLDIELVVAGSKHDEHSRRNHKAYTAPRAAGKFEEPTSESGLTVTQVVNRILAEKDAYKAKVIKKTAAEQEYYDERYGFDGQDSPPGPRTRSKKAT